MSKLLKIDQHYHEWIQNISQRFRSSQGKAVSNFSLTLPAPQNDLAQAIANGLVFQHISYQSLFRSNSREACQRLRKLKQNYQYSA